MDAVELSRRLENIIRLGTVAEVDHAARRVRVQTGGLLTQWLKWRAGRAGATRTWNPPTVGEQVMILSPSGVLENGIVMPSIYSDDYDAPSHDPDCHVVEFPDGARMIYNHRDHLLTIDVADIRVTGNMVVEGNMVSHDIVLHTHRHGGVEPGGGTSGEPVP